MKQAAGLEPAQEDPFAGAKLTDGTYEAKTSEPDSNGFTDVVTLTVKDGAITEASWGCCNRGRFQKRALCPKTANTQ